MQVAFRHQFGDDKWAFVKRMADERLVVTGRSEEGDRETVEVVHEALIKNWKPLRNWINEDRTFRVWQNNLRQAMADWRNSGEDAGALLRGVRLSEAEEKLEQRRSELGGDEIAFIRQSAEFREKEEKERQRREREKLQRNIRRIVFASFAVLLASVGGWAWSAKIERQKLEKSLLDTRQAKNRAEEKEKEAAEQLREARHNMGYVFYEKMERSL